MDNNAADFENYQLSQKHVELYIINITDTNKFQYIDQIVKNESDQFNHTFQDRKSSEINTWVSSLEEFQLRFLNIKVEIPPNDDHGANCLMWNVIQRFYHIESPQIRVDLEIYPTTCEDSLPLTDFWWLNAMTVIFAIISFLLDLQNILETLSIIRRLKQRFSKDLHQSIQNEEQ